MILIFLHEVTFASRVEIDLIDFFFSGTGGGGWGGKGAWDE